MSSARALKPRSDSQGYNSAANGAFLGDDAVPLEQFDP